MKIALASCSKLKLSALDEACCQIFGDDHDAQIVTFEVNNSNSQIQQPLYEGGRLMGIKRYKTVYQKLLNLCMVHDYDLLVVVENYMDFFQCWKDEAFIRVYDLKNDIFYTQIEHCGNVPNGEEEDDQNEMELMEQVLEKHNIIYGNVEGKSKIIGSKITFGQLYHQKYPKVPANDWTGDVEDRTRKESLVSGLFSCLVDMYENRKLLEEVESKFRFYPDFPKPGVNFLSWDDIFLDPKLVSDFYQYIALKYVGPDEAHLFQNRDKPVVDLVIGLESRGFLLSGPVAQALGAGQILMRKAGKIAGPKVSRSYRKEYGSDTFELRDDLKPQRVILIDDVLATGGSLEAAANLARSAGHTVVDCIVVKDVEALREVAEEKLKGIPYRVIL